MQDLISRQAALKKARILRGENPTPVTLEESDQSLVEECTDVELCIRELNIASSPWIEEEKVERFQKRWEADHDRG